MAKNQTLVQFRVDSDLKNEVSEIYSALGMDLPTAFRMFMVRSKMVRGIPLKQFFLKVLLQEQRDLKRLKSLESRQLTSLKCLWTR